MATRALNMLDDGSAAGVVSVLPVASFSGVFRELLALVFRDNRKAAQNVEVACPLWISWRRRDLSLLVKLRAMALANETVSMSSRQAVCDFVLLERVSDEDGLWQVAGELRSSDVSWLKTAEVVLVPCTAKSQTVTASTNVTLVDSMSLRSVVLQKSHVVRSIPDALSLVSSVAMLQSLVLESTEGEPALLSLGHANVLSKSRVTA
ncbi:Carbohydrate-binding protein [Phytophthora palmivora]|uniref:Carbohydrate-binding protein n=1 Tax=Phytophthora palmivora TaxID=4796 RepID=A0A2P4YUZ8_9STRA|nr:Carbohydrate-binding protein [Phytophthora palmivora]